MILLDDAIIIDGIDSYAQFCRLNGDACCNVFIFDVIKVEEKQSWADKRVFRNSQCYISSGRMRTVTMWKPEG